MVPICYIHSHTPNIHSRPRIYITVVSTYIQVLLYGEIASLFKVNGM